MDLICQVTKLEQVNKNNKLLLISIYINLKKAKEKANIGKKAAEKSGGLFSADDWMCKS